MKVDPPLMASLFPIIITSAVAVRALEFPGVITAQEQIQAEARIDSEGNITQSEGKQRMMLLWNMKVM